MICNLEKEKQRLVVEGDVAEVKAVLKACNILCYDKGFSPDERRALLKVSQLIPPAEYGGWWGYEDDGEIG